MNKNKANNTIKSIRWNNNFAYAIGLLVTDGSLSKDTRHFDFTSKDMEQINNFKKCLNLTVKTSYKSSSYAKDIKYYHVQFGDVILYQQLINIGLMPNKTKIIGKLKIPDKYFFDFLRGHFDGDGSSYSYWDKRWKSSFLIYTTFTSASLEHVHWIKNKLTKLLSIKGHITKSGSVFNLRYAKKESITLLRKLYYKKEMIFLKRKFLKINKVLAIIGKEIKL